MLTVKTGATTRHLGLWLNSSNALSPYIPPILLTRVGNFGAHLFTFRPKLYFYDLLHIINTHEWVFDRVPSVNEVRGLRNLYVVVVSGKPKI